jgi:hypothetical protein
MSEAIEQPGGVALPRPMGIGEILGTAWQFYRRHWRTLLAIAAVVVVPVTLLQYLLGEWVRIQGEVTETTSNGVVSTLTWTAGIAGLVAALAGILMFLVLTGAITRAVAAEVAGEDPGVEQSYRFGFHRLGPVLLVSVLVGLANLAGLIVFVIPRHLHRGAPGGQHRGAGGGGPAGDAGHGSFLGAGRRSLVARVRDAARGRPAHRGGEFADHRAVRGHGPGHPGDRRGGGDGGSRCHMAYWSACCCTWTCGPGKSA